MSSCTCEANMQTVLLQLGRLDGKMDSLILRQAQHDVTLDKHDERLKFLEGRWAYVLGAAAAIAILVSYALRA